METHGTTDPSILERALKSALDQPAYKDILDFYGPLFQAQEDAAHRCDPETIEISAEMTAIKNKEGFPLLSPPEFKLDPVECRRTLKAVLDLAAGGTEALSRAAAGLRSGLEEGKTEVETLCRALLAENETELEQQAASLEIDSAALSFLAYAALKPSLEAGARKLSALLPAEPRWERGYCPLCGSAAVLSILGEMGQRELVCSFCWHTWPTTRIGCPHCGNRQVDQLQYFFSTDEPAYRVNVCDACRHYVKTVDLRGLKRPFYAPLEHVLTLHLDLQAQDKGLRTTPCLLAAV